jgi:hypothetical protein
VNEKIPGVNAESHPSHHLLDIPELFDKFIFDFRLFIQNGSIASTVYSMRVFIINTTSHAKI